MFNSSLSLCVCSTFVRVKRFNNSTKGDFQKYLCRKIELVDLCYFVLFFLSFHLLESLLQFCFVCVLFSAFNSLALLSLVLLICFLFLYICLGCPFFAQSFFCVASLKLSFSSLLFNLFLSFTMFYQTHVTLFNDALSVCECESLLLCFVLV